jgi:D-alanyl-D-alanine carboxypeptidase (penicillin-binding protein 5/6)
MFTIPVLAKEDLAPNSESAILLEVSTGKILYEKNADSKLAPASMTKIMSMLLIMEAVDDGKISMDDEVIISENAASMGGSQIFLQAGEKYKVEELLKGIAVASGNDAVVAMAEKVGGSVDGFVEMMNKRAEELGLTNTHFDNPHGLDSETHYTTARDMSVMARELLKHEKILEFTSIYEDYLKKNDGSSIWLVNTNRLVRFYEGVDGLKTGYTTNAGYCITTTALRNNLRLLSVVMNAPSSDLRSKDTTNMLNYGFNNYKLDILLDKTNDLGNLSIIKGKKETTKIYLKDNVTILSKINDEKGTYDYNIVIEKENAPIESNEKVGYVEVIDNEGNIIKEQDLIVKEEIKKANIWDLFKKTLSTISSGNFT